MTKEIEFLMSVEDNLAEQYFAYDDEMWLSRFPSESVKRDIWNEWVEATDKLVKTMESYNAKYAF